MRRLGSVLIGALACGPTSDEGDDSSDPTLDESPDPTLDYSRCDESRGYLADEIQHADTARFDGFLAQAIVDGGYVAVAELVYGQMIESNAVRYCATVRLGTGWFAAIDYDCFEHADDAQMQAAFAEYVVSWPELPDELIPLAEVEATANECFADIYRAYRPCDYDSDLAFELTYSTERWVSACGLETDVATVDLATGALVKCETRVSDGCDYDD